MQRQQRRQQQMELMGQMGHVGQMGQMGQEHMGGVQGKRHMAEGVHAAGKYRALGDTGGWGCEEDKGQSKEKSLLEAQLEELMSEAHSTSAHALSCAPSTAPAPHVLSSAAISLLLNNALAPLPGPATTPSSQAPTMHGATVPPAQGGRP
ncbi:hypothetical protein CLOP_g1559 [Closterium sp. NIES-67]|nr:hypothetical protein CLOP_g1559 [Closterium sp. NIES-67]